MAIKFAHIRTTKGFVFDGIETKDIVDNLGGMTIAYEKFNEFYGFDTGDKISEYIVAVSKCHPKENFHKAKGRIIAAGRLASPKQSKTYQANSIPNLINQVRLDQQF